MSLYLTPRKGKSSTIAVCGRCRMKKYLTDLKPDPNNGQWYCEGCVDEYDPWRLPSRRVETVTVDNPRKDEDLSA